MQNFNWSSFTKKIGIKSNLEAIYSSWTKSADIEKWFLKTANYFDRDSNLVNKNKNIEKGFTYKWSWYLSDNIEKGNILNCNGRDFLQFTFAGDCNVEVKLTQLDENVIVELTQSNIPTDEASKQNIRLGCASGWSFYLVNLKSVYEGGIDLRNKEAALKEVINN